MARMTRSQVAAMARDAREVYTWAMRSGLKQDRQIEEMAKGLAVDLIAAGVEIVDDSNTGEAST